MINTSIITALSTSNKIRKYSWIIKVRLNTFYDNPYKLCSIIKIAQPYNYSNVVNSTPLHNDKLLI
jgi:hypothetical protein